MKASVASYIFMGFALLSGSVNSSPVMGGRIDRNFCTQATHVGRCRATADCCPGSQCAGKGIYQGTCQLIGGKQTIEVPDVSKRHDSVDVKHFVVENGSTGSGVTTRPATNFKRDPHYPGIKPFPLGPVLGTPPRTPTTPGTNEQGPKPVIKKRCLFNGRVGCRTARDCCSGICDSISGVCTAH